MQPEDLLKIGFTLTEAKIYLTLLEFGPLQAGAISKKTQINRRTTYDTIERLIKRGYLSYSITANKRLFKATNPEIIINKIKDMEKQAKELSPQLVSLFNKSKEEHEANLYRGRHGIRSILQEILKEKEYLVFGSNEKFPEIMKHDFVLFQKQKKDFNIKSKTIMSISMKNKPILKEAFTEYRFIQQEYSLPTSTFIYGNKVATIIWAEIPTGMVVENKDVAESFRHYFLALWKLGKK